MADSASLRILVGVDDSDSARAAMAHVAAVFPGANKPQLTLLHVLVQAIPPSIEFVDPSMIWDGAGLPPALATETAEQIASQKEAARQRVQRLFDEIVPGNWPADRLEVLVVEGGFTRAAIAEIITYQAKQSSADVVVVGRTRHGALHEALIKSTGERLVHACKATAVWVVSV
ncbi:MAG: universal stress protein [Phycisphaerales bacterium]|nr:universal stress protein [Phycisphaerales bacterium]